MNINSLTNSLTGYLIKYGIERHTAEDLAQDTLLHFIEHDGALSTIDIPLYFAKARQLVIDNWRRQRPVLVGDMGAVAARQAPVVEAEDDPDILPPELIPILELRLSGYTWVGCQTELGYGQYEFNQLVNRLRDYCNKLSNCQHILTIEGN